MRTSLNRTDLRHSRRHQPWRTTDRLTGDQVAALIVRYEAGETSRELSVMFGISKTAVVNLLRDNGVQIRPRGVPPSP